MAPRALARWPVSCIMLPSLLCLGVMAQKNSTCPESWDLSADASLAGGDIRAALEEASECYPGESSPALVVTVACGAGTTIEVNETISVSFGVELRVVGVGGGNLDWGNMTTTAATTTSPSASSTSSSGGAVEPSVFTRTIPNTTAGIFAVEAGGVLQLSGLTLRGGDDGGRAVNLLKNSHRPQVIANNCLWEDLSAEEPGGAIYAKGWGNVTLSGTNVFSNCSSGSGGGAIFLDGKSVLYLDGRVVFDGCTAGGDGGAMEASTTFVTVTTGSRVEIRDCYAADKGGGMYVKGSNLIVSDAASLSLSGCTTGAVGGGGEGGGLYSSNSSVFIGADAELMFLNNSSPSDGGGFYGRATTVATTNGSVLRFVDNVSADDGGGMNFQWSDDDSSWGDVEDRASHWVGTCLDLVEGATAIFEGNSAVQYGGGAELLRGCGVSIKGTVYFERNTGERGGAFYVSESEVLIAGNATLVENKANRWGGAIMIIDSPTALNITGRVSARRNSAGRSGGMLYSENAGLFVSVSSDQDADGTLWEGNSAGYDGGVIAVDGGVVMLEGGLASTNMAAQRGGVLFATGSSAVEWVSGESRNNTAGSGGSLYISSSDVNVTDVRLDGDRTPSGGTVFLAGANARFVNTTHVASGDLKGDFALHVDSWSVLSALYCSFDNWSGTNSMIVSEGTTVMDACDFSGSPMDIIVQASEEVTIRNAILGDKNYDSADYDPTATFGEGLHTCATLPDERSCLSNGEDEACVDAEHEMGVLCTAYVAAATGEEISLSGEGSEAELVTSDTSSTTEGVVFYPDQVTKDLVLRHPSAALEASSSAEEGDAFLWELRLADGTTYGQSAVGKGEFVGVSSDNFSWGAVPASGLLNAGAEVTIHLVGTPPPPPNSDVPSAVYNGEVSAAFQVVTRTADAGSTVASDDVSFEMHFYYCPKGSYWDGDDCVSCAETMAKMADGSSALDCSMDGVTLDTLPLAEGHWRGDVTKTLVRSCVYPPACAGGRGFSSDAASSGADEADAVVTAAADIAPTIFENARYCEKGYRGPLCAICADGFRRLSGRQCLDCGGGWGLGAIVAAVAMLVLLPVALIALVLFLIIGPSAFVQIKRRMEHCCGWSKNVGVSEWVLEDSVVKQRRDGNGAIGGKHQEDSEGTSRGSSQVTTRGDAARGLGARLLRSIPFQKLKILIVVWQILTQFSGLADIPYPPSYKRFLGFLDIFDFDISWPLKASCIMGDITFYETLLAVTLGPITALVFLLGTYMVALRWHRGLTRSNVENRQGAVVRHASAALLVLFLVFSSVSTTVFSTFPCDYIEDLEVSLLRADYSISCDHPDHIYYRAYAGLMIIVYPIGIPVMFAYLLLKRRNKINPPVAPPPSPGPTDPFLAGKHRDTNSPLTTIASPSAVRFRGSSTFVCGAFGGCGGGSNGGGAHGLPVTTFDGITDDRLSRRVSRSTLARASSLIGLDRFSKTAMGASEDLALKPAFSVEAKREEVLQRRADDLDLQPTRFLWEPYDPRNYYYETVECGRRCLLTGALVFVLPNTAGQVAGACVFAFLSLFAFERMRPHLSDTDAWMYRIGCVVVFFSNFLGLMAKAEITQEDSYSQEMFGILLIGVHASLVIAIIAQAFITMQSMSDSRDDLVATLTKSSSAEELLDRTCARSENRSERHISSKDFVAARKNELGGGSYDRDARPDVKSDQVSSWDISGGQESKAVEMRVIKGHADPNDSVLADVAPSRQGNARIGRLPHLGLSKTRAAAASSLTIDDRDDRYEAGKRNGSGGREISASREDRGRASLSAPPYQRFDSEKAEIRAVVHPRPAHVLRRLEHKPEMAAPTARAPAAPPARGLENAFVGRRNPSTGRRRGGIRGGDRQGHRRCESMFSRSELSFDSIMDGTDSIAPVPRLSMGAISTDMAFDTPPTSASSAHSRLSGSLIDFARESRAEREANGRAWGENQGYSSFVRCSLPKLGYTPGPRVTTKSRVSG